MSHPGTALDALTEMVDGAALQLRGEDLGAAIGALREICDRIPEVMRNGVEPPRRSVIAPMPAGPLVRLTELPDDPLSLRRIVDLVDEVLVERDLDPGSAVLRAIDGLNDLDRCRRAVVARLFPPPAGTEGRISPAWIDLAADWVFGDQPPDAEVRMRVLGVEETVKVRDAGGILHGCAKARAWCDLVTGQVNGRVRTASISFGYAPHAAVAAGGPRCDDTGLLARFELLTEVARAFNDCAYFCIDFEETFEDLGMGLADAAWPREGGEKPNRVAGSVIDRAIPEVYPVQVLGAAHMARLGTVPPQAEEIAPDRWLVPIGRPEHWLVDSELRAAVLDEGRNLLRPLLLPAGSLDAISEDDAADDIGTDIGSGPERRCAPDAPDASDDSDAPDTTAAPTARSDLPDLDAVVIEPASHARRGMRLTVLELAAWLAGEPHSDAPTSVSAVLRAYVRELGAGVSSSRRQRLRGIAGSLVGTGADGPEVEEARCWLLADRLLRIDAPAWLRVAGLTEAADRLDQLESILEDTQLVRGVDLVGNAITTASRRLEITEAIAEEHSEAVDAIAWEAWEEAAQQTGWSAAVDAVTMGIPGELTFATDQRVMDLSRDPDERAALEASTRGLGDETWSTGLYEVAGAAWRNGWEAAEELVRHESTFSLRTTLRRSYESRAAAGDPYEILLEEIDAAARTVISRLILVGDSSSDYWARGVRAAERVDGGADWLAALEDARSALGAALFDEAMDTAQKVMAGWARRAARLVSRAVVASVTREACSVAGRGVAARAAASAFGHGGTEDDALAAAREAVAPLVDALADDAVDLIHELVSIDRQ